MISTDKISTTSLQGMDEPVDDYDIFICAKEACKGVTHIYVGFPLSNPLAFRPDKIMFGCLCPVTYHGEAVTELPPGYYYVELTIEMDKDDAMRMMNILLEEQIPKMLFECEYDGDGLCQIQ